MPQRSITMRLMRELERKLETEQSYFQAHLLREDIARLARMRDLAPDAADAIAFRKAVLRLGWTAGDLRTHEIREPLEMLADAIYSCVTAAGEGTSDREEQEARIEQAWLILHRVRMERLMGCLSTPVPKPAS
jgi:LPS sulfotransferase NodH